MPGGLRGLQNRCRLVPRAEVGSIPILSAIFLVKGGDDDVPRADPQAYGALIVRWLSFQA